MDIKYHFHCTFGNLEKRLKYLILFFSITNLSQFTYFCRHLFRFVEKDLKIHTLLLDEGSKSLGLVTSTLNEVRKGTQNPTWVLFIYNKRCL